MNMELAFAQAGSGTGTTGFSSFNQGGSDAESSVKGGIQAWDWVIAFLPVAFGVFVAFKVNEYLNQKDEQSQGQTEPKASRYFKVLSGFIVGIMIIYICLGMFGLVFAGKSFADSWQTFVVDFWSTVF